MARLDLYQKDPKELTKDELLYLQDRDRLPEGFEAVEQTDREGGETVLVAVPGGSATVPKNRVGEFTGHGDEEDVVLVESYEEMGVEDLKSELSLRRLPVSGNKADLIARLEEDDNKSE